MKKKALLSVLIISAFLLSGSAFAGFDPTPFMPEINKLGAIENSLNSIDERIKAVLGIPPDDQIPAPVEKLNAMSHQLELLNEFMMSTMGEIINAVLGTPPDDQMPVIDALNAIGAVMRNDSPEGGICDVVQAYLNEYFPNGTPPELMEFYNALIQFSGNANLIIGNVSSYIDQITSSPAGCSSYDNETDCNAVFGCTWSFDTGTCDVVGS